MADLISPQDFFGPQKAPQSAAGQPNGLIAPEDFFGPTNAQPAQAPSEGSLPSTGSSAIDAPLDALHNFTAQANRAATFGLSDKVAAAVPAVNEFFKRLLGYAAVSGAADAGVQLPIPDTKNEPTISDVYHDELNKQRAEGENYATEHPIASKVATTLGTVASIPMTGAAEGVAAAPTLGAKMLQGAKQGATIGGLTGFGNSNDQSLSQTALDTGIGAVTGGAVGTAAPVVAEKAVQPLMDWFARRYGTAAVDNQAVRTIAQRMQQDAAAGGPSAQDILDLLNAAPAGKPITIADLAGRNVVSKAGNLARQPGEASQLVSDFLNKRDVGAGTRLASDVDQALGAGSSYDTAQALMKARSAAAAPAYDAAYAANPLNPDTIAAGGALDKLMSRPSMRDAAHRALNLAAEEGRDPASLGITFNQTGDPLFERVPSWQTLDYVKRGLDDVVEQYRDPTSGRLVLDTRGNAVNKTRADFLSFLDQENPSYAAARAAYAGPSQSLSAMKQGQTIFSRRPEQIADDLKALSPGDQEFYRLGAADALRTKIAQTSSGGDEARRIVGSQYIQDQLRPLFPNDNAYQRFIDSALAENRMFGTKYDVLGNSRTASRLAEDAAGENGAMGHLVRAGTAAMEGAPIAAGLSALRGVMSMRAINGDPRVNLAMAKALFSSNPQANRELLTHIIAGQTAPSMLPGVTVPLSSLAARGAPALLRGAPQP